MKTNLTKETQGFIPLATEQVDIAAGAAGWVDTVFASSAFDSGFVTFVITCVSSAGAALVGARALGSTIDNKTVCTNSVTILTKQSNSKHIELYRNAAINVSYYLVGYLSL